jgi:hypothetical protein
MTTSLSILAITTKILALREARMLWVCLLTSLSNSLHMKYSKGFQSSELGGQISLGQWSFRLAFRCSPGWFWLCGQGSVLLEHVGTFSGNSLHLGLHQGVQNLYVLLGVDHLCPISKKWGSMLSPFLEMTPQDHDRGWKFCVAFGQEWHQPPQHPGFGTKLSSNGKPGTCALLETVQSPVVFFRRAKLLSQLHEFHTLPKHFWKKRWFVYIVSYQRWTAFQKVSHKISVISRCLNI